MYVIAMSLESILLTITGTRLMDGIMQVITAFDRPREGYSELSQRFIWAISLAWFHGLASIKRSTLKAIVFRFLLSFNSTQLFIKLLLLRRFLRFRYSETNCFALIEECAAGGGSRRAFKTALLQIKIMN